jgi:hypothetical protein
MFLFFKYVLVRTGTYCLVQMWNSRTVMYRHVLVCTSTYRYVPTCQILSRGTGPGFQMDDRCPSLLCTKPVELHRHYEKLLERGLCSPPGVGDAAQIAYFFF